MSIIPMYIYITTDNKIEILGIWDNISLEYLKIIKEQLNKMNLTQHLKNDECHYILFISYSEDAGDFDIPSYEFKITSWENIQNHIIMTTTKTNETNETIFGEVKDMEEVCKKCWNEGCRKKEDVRKSKVDTCVDMEANPEKWKEFIESRKDLYK